jgi:hypothetical protein
MFSLLLQADEIVFALCKSSFGAIILQADEIMFSQMVVEFMLCNHFANAHALSPSSITQELLRVIELVKFSNISNCTPRLFHLSELLPVVLFWSIDCIGVVSMRCADQFLVNINQRVAQRTKIVYEEATVMSLLGGAQGRGRVLRWPLESPPKRVPVANQ